MFQQLAGVAMGLFNGENDRRQLRQQEKLNVMNNEHAKQMGLFNYDLQKKMWDDTNYSAQIEHMEKAGINPALLYGMSGGGGVTTGSASAQQPSGKAERTDQMGMGLQMGMAMEQQKAQIEVLESQAEKNRAEAAKTKGIDTEAATTQNELSKVQLDIASRTKEQTIEGIGYQVNKSYKELSLLTYEEQVQGDEDVLNARIKGTQAGYLQAILQNKQIKAQTKLTDEQAKAIATQIAQKWAEIGQGNMKLAIDTFKAEVEANRPGLWNVLGGQVQEIIESIYDIGGVKDNDRNKLKIKK